MRSKYVWNYKEFCNSRRSEREVGGGGKEDEGIRVIIDLKERARHRSERAGEKRNHRSERAITDLKE